jgi:hypothetical protein
MPHHPRPSVSPPARALVPRIAKHDAFFPAEQAVGLDHIADVDRWPL